jgi:hypothetical protein
MSLVHRLKQPPPHRFQPKTSHYKYHGLSARDLRMLKPLQAVEREVHSIFAALVRSTAKRLLSDVGYKDTLSSYAVRGGQISELTSHPHDLAFSFSKFAANCHLCSMQAGQILQLKHCHMAPYVTCKLTLAPASSSSFITSLLFMAVLRALLYILYLIFLFISAAASSSNLIMR